MGLSLGIRSTFVVQGGGIKVTYWNKREPVLQVVCFSLLRVIWM